MIDDSQAKLVATGELRRVFFSKDAIEDVLNGPGADGVHFYIVEGEDGKPTMIAVAYDNQGVELRQRHRNLTDPPIGVPCPPHCPSNNGIQQKVKSEYRKMLEPIR